MKNDRTADASPPAAEKDRIIAGIFEEARQESERVIEQERERIQARRAGLEQRIATIRREARQTAARQVEEIERRTEARIARERRKGRLELSERLLRLSVEGASKELSGLSESEEYRDILAGWIAEGVLGLSASEVEVYAGPPDDPVMDDGCNRARAEIRRLSGEEVTIRPMSSRGDIGQGVVISAVSVPMVFTNTVSARMKRYAAEIRRIVDSEMDGIGNDGERPKEESEDRRRTGA